MLGGWGDIGTVIDDSVTSGVVVDVVIVDIVEIFRSMIVGWKRWSTRSSLTRDRSRLGVNVTTPILSF